MNNGFFLTEKTAADLKRLIDAAPGGGLGRQGGRWATPEWQAVQITVDEGGGDYTGQILAFDLQANDWVDLQLISVREFNGGTLVVGKTYPALRVSADLAFANAGSSGDGGSTAIEGVDYFCPDTDIHGPCNGTVASATWQISLNITSDTCPDCEDVNGTYTLAHGTGLVWLYDDANVTITYTIFGNNELVQASLSVIVKACADIEYVYELKGLAGVTEDYCALPCTTAFEDQETPEYSRFFASFFGEYWTFGDVNYVTNLTYPIAHQVHRHWLEEVSAEEVIYIPAPGDIVLLMWCCFASCSFMQPYVFTSEEDLMELKPAGPLDLIVTGPFSSLDAAKRWGACYPIYGSDNSGKIVQSLADGCTVCSPKLPVKCCSANTLALITDDDSCNMPTYIVVTPTVLLPCDETLCSDPCCDGNERVILINRGTDTRLSTLRDGELSFDHTTDTLYIGTEDGSYPLFPDIISGGSF